MKIGIMMLGNLWELDVVFMVVLWGKFCMVVFELGVFMIVFSNVVGKLECMFGVRLFNWIM